MTVATAQPRPCSVARTLDIVGEKWALLAVREVFLGNRKFDEMIRRTGAPRDTLAARLRTLVGAGILERRQYCEHPARYEYRLTDAGRDLYPVITTLMRWGDKYLAGDGVPAVVLQHHRRAPRRGAGHLPGVRRAAGPTGHHAADRRHRIPRRTGGQPLGSPRGGAYRCSMSGSLLPPSSKVPAPQRWPPMVVRPPKMLLPLPGFGPGSTLQ